MSKPDLFKAESFLWPSLILATTALYIYSWISHSTSIKFDDAYMYIRYADNILAGKGYSWNGDQNTFGCTSIAYALFVTGIRWMFPDASNHGVLLVSSGFWGLATLCLLSFTFYRLAMSPKLKQGLWIAAVLSVYFVTNFAFKYHMLTGMDTTMSMFTNTLLILLSFEAAQRKKLLWYFLLAFAAWFTVLTRPDNFFYAFLVPGLVMLWIFNSGLKNILLFYLLLIVIFAIDTAVKYSVFGDPLPLPYYVKKTDFYQGYIGSKYWNPVVYLANFATYAYPFVAGLILFFKKQWAKPVLALLLPMVLTFAYYFTVVQIMGSVSRFYFPSIVFLATASFWVFNKYIMLRKQESNEDLLPIIAKRLPYLINRLPHLAIAGTIWIATMLVGDKVYDKYFLNNNSVPQEQINYVAKNKRKSYVSKWEVFEIASKICSQLPKGTLLATSELGKIGAENPHIPIFDLLGLHEPEVAYHGFSTRYFQLKAPDLVWMPHYHYVTLNYTLLNDPWFQENYYFLPGILRFGIAIRKDRDDIFKIVLKEIKKHYPREMYQQYLPQFMLDELHKPAAESL